MEDIGMASAHHGEEGNFPEANLLVHASLLLQHLHDHFLRRAAHALSLVHALHNPAEPAASETQVELEAVPIQLQGATTTITV